MLYPTQTTRHSGSCSGSLATISSSFSMIGALLSVSGNDAIPLPTHSQLWHFRVSCDNEETQIDEIRRMGGSIQYNPSIRPQRFNGDVMIHQSDPTFSLYIPYCTCCYQYEDHFDLCNVKTRQPATSCQRPLITGNACCSKRSAECPNSDRFRCSLFERDRLSRLLLSLNVSRSLQHPFAILRS